MLEKRAYSIRECLTEFNGDHGLAARYLLQQLDEWAQNLTVRYPELLLEKFGAAQPLLHKVAAARTFISDHFLFPEKLTTRQFILESELLARHILNSSLNEPWNSFCESAKTVNRGKEFQSLWREMVCVRMHVNMYPDTPLARNLNPVVEGYLYVLKEVVELGEFINKTVVTDLLTAFLKFIHTAGVERNCPTTPDAWTDTEDKRFRLLSDREYETEKRKDENILGSCFVFCDWREAEILLGLPQLNIKMYNARCATIMDVKDPYNRVILYAFTNLLIDIVQVKAGQIADSKIRTILIQAMRSVSNVAAMREMVAAQAKQQEKSEKGVRANKRRSNESLAWVAAAAQILWNAEPYLSNREVVAVLFSAEKRANKAKPPIDPAAQAILREGPKRPLTRRTIRNKLTEARALGLVVSPQETASQSTEESAP